MKFYLLFLTRFVKVEGNAGRKLGGSTFLLFYGMAGSLFNVYCRFYGNQGPLFMSLISYVKLLDLL